MTTINLSASETKNYSGAARADLKMYAKRTAVAKGRRFAQIVGSDGRILDVVEAIG